MGKAKYLWNKKSCYLSKNVGKDAYQIDVLSNRKTLSTFLKYNLQYVVLDVEDSHLPEDRGLDMMNSGDYLLVLILSS